MPDWLRALFAPPVFEGDSEKTRVGGLLNTVLWVLYLTPLVIGLNALFIPNIRIMSLRVIVLITVGLIFALYMMRRGHVRSMSLSVVGMLLLLTGYLVYLNGGAVRPANLFFALIIVIAALLLGGRGAVWSAVVSAIILGVLTYAGAAGLITARIAPPPPALAWISQAVEFILIGLVLRLSSNSLGAALVLAQQSVRDPVTGLFNRRYMEETLEREIRRAARDKSPVAIIMLDIDHFKSFNDAYGHEAGDLVLREIGALLRVLVRAEDIACRFGGEEFTLIMPAASAAVTEPRAENIRKQVKGLAVHHRGQALGQITVSLGIAVCPDHGTTGEAVLAAADAALYRAKHAGRDRVMVAQAGDNTHPTRASGAR